MTGSNRRSASSRHRNRGFTLIELVMVVLIVGIVAAVGAPRYTKALDAVYAKTAAARVQSDLKYARQLARQTSREQKVTFDLDTNSYSIIDAHSLVGAKSLDRADEDYTVTLSSNEFNAEITGAEFNEGLNSVTFDIYGHAGSAGTVTVQSGGRTETIVVDAYGNVR